MSGRTMLYRGSLKSCNYHCSYCPFSKHPMTAGELEKDREQWLSFVETFTEHAGLLDIRALMVAPYGEALLHPWYWEGLARITACLEVDAAGAQTNLSFPVRESLARYRERGGDVQKLRIWATFHPEMTTVEMFAEQCAELRDAGIAMCAGAVGVPEHIGILRILRDRLPEDIYLWINGMDGRKRPYTEDELKAFQDMDPFFQRELLPVPADVSRCRRRIFMEGDGKLRTCNMSPFLDIDWKALCTTADFPEPLCTRKTCSCYLAYGGRDDQVNQRLFGSYPVFRIPSVATS